MQKRRYNRGTEATGIRASYSMFPSFDFLVRLLCSARLPCPTAPSPNAASAPIIHLPPPVNAAADCYLHFFPTHLPPFHLAPPCCYTFFSGWLADGEQSGRLFCLLTTFKALLTRPTCSSWQQSDVCPRSSVVSTGCIIYRRNSLRALLGWHLLVNDKQLAVLEL